jgi:hypothetical protein
VRVKLRANALGADATERRAVRLKIYRQKNKAALYQKKKAYMAANPDKVKGWKRADYERQIVIDQHFRI